MRAEERRNETQCERRLSKDLNDEQKRAKKKKNGKKTILAAKKTYKTTKKHIKTQKGLTVRQTERECRLDREREREIGRWEAAQQKSLCLFSGPSEKSKRDTNTRNRLRMGRAVPSFLAQGNWIEFPVGRSNSLVASVACVAFFKVWRKNKKKNKNKSNNGSARNSQKSNNNKNEANETKSSEDLRNS